MSRAFAEGSLCYPVWLTVMLACWACCPLDGILPEGGWQQVVC